MPPRPVSWQKEELNNNGNYLIVVQITTTMIILYHFGRLSLVTLLTNFLILPIQPGVMIWGGIATLLGLVVQPLGQVVGWVAWVFLTFTIEVVRLTARVPFASAEVQMDGWMVFAYYALLVGLTWYLAQPRDKKPGFFLKTWFLRTLKAKVLASAAAILLVLAFFAWRTLPDGRLHVVFLDVGQGDAIFIQTPSGRQVLVDGGPSETVLLSQLGRQMPFWDRTLDLMVLTHPDSDHVTGLAGVLERYQVDTVIFREVEHESEVYEYWLQLLGAEGATVYQGEAGLRLTLDEELEMVVLHPGVELVGGREGNANNNSVITRLTYGHVSVLLPGDIEAKVEQRLVTEEAPLGSTVLKAAHHGSCSSTTQEFLDAVDPEVVVISVGADNHFGHPCDEVVERLDVSSQYSGGDDDCRAVLLTAVRSDSKSDLHPPQVFEKIRLDLALSPSASFGINSVEGGFPVYSTDEQGVVEVITDGTRLWVETER